MNRIHFTLAALALGWASGCAAPLKRSDAGVPQPQPQLELSPPDLTSSYRGPLRVELNNGWLPVSTALLQAVAASVELLELPSGQTVPARVTIHNPPRLEPPEDGAPTRPSAEEDPGLRRRARVEVVPEVTLGPGWYALALRAVPARVTLAASGARRSGLGAFAARFSPESHPVLRTVEICETDAGRSAYLTFSEPVRVKGVDVDDAVRLAAGASARCTYVPGRPADAEAKLALHERCGNEDASGPWTLTLPGSLSAASGAAVETLDGQPAFEVTLDRERLPRSQRGCVLWRP